MQQEETWLSYAAHRPSPNYNQRPDNNDISLLVIHNISLPAGEFGGPYIEQLFCNTLDCTCHPSFTSLIDLKVSSHFLIRRDGELIQFVALEKRAWHAGQSQFAGRDNCNDYSIGVELEGTDHGHYTGGQLHQLVLLTKDLLGRYPYLTTDRIVGHSTIAPGRKTDPGPAFDWGLFKTTLSSELQNQ